jgi:hypothetical protein
MGRRSAEKTAGKKPLFGSSIFGFDETYELRAR